MGKKFEIVGDDISDGYHTFEELYEHRCLLFIVLALKWPGRTYWTTAGEGWLIVGMVTPYGQVSYHVPDKYRELVEGKIEKGGPQWDGHTSKDVANRLLFWAESQEATESASAVEKVTKE